MAFVDHYATLNISEFSSLEEIKNAFRELAKKYHPDKNKAENASQKFREIFEAYEILKNPITKKIFDERRKEFYESRNSFVQNSNPIFNQEYKHTTQEARKKAEYFSRMSFDDFLKSSIFLMKKATIGLSIILMFIFGVFMILFGFYMLAAMENADNGIAFGSMLFCCAFGGSLIYIAQKDFKKA